MAIIQTIRGNDFIFFHDLCNYYQTRTLSLYRTAAVVADVFDRYDNEMSVKSPERKRRGNDGICQYKVRPASKIPDWRKFLLHGKNKEGLADLISVYMEEKMPAALADGQSYHIGGGYQNGETAKVINHDEVTEAIQLYTAQEEADSRMILYVKEANEYFSANKIRGTVIVQSPDTDVLILLVHFYGKFTSITNLWLETGKTARTIRNHRYIPVHEIAESIGQISTVLPAAHALTGCDTVSSMYR